MAVANPNSMSGAAEARAAQEIDLSDFTTQVDDTYHALRAFNFLLEHVTEYMTGGFSGTINYGIAHLLRHQIDDLEEIKGTVYDLVDRVRRAERAATAPAHGLPPDMVVLPTYYPGIERDLRAKAEARQVDLAEIARSTNLKEETVRRVMGRLLADPDTAMEEGGTASA
jgi:hypothetical protein